MSTEKSSNARAGKSIAPKLEIQVTGNQVVSMSFSILDGKVAGIIQVYDFDLW